LWRRSHAKAQEPETEQEIKAEPLEKPTEPETVEKAPKTMAKAKSTKAKTEQKPAKPYEDVIAHVREFHKDMKPVSSICSTARCILTYFEGPENVPTDKAAFLATGYMDAFKSGSLTGGNVPSEGTIRNQSWYWRKTVDALASYK
jgi:hypothetical protein